MPSPQLHKRRRGHKLGYWFALALLIHAELLLVVGLVMYFRAPREADLIVAAGQGGPGESIEIGALDSESARKIIADLDRQAEKAKEEEIKKEVESPEAPGQVVDLPRAKEEKRPDKARFAAEHDSSVEKETKKFGKFDEKARQGSADGQGEVSRPAAPAVQPSQAAAARPAMPDKLTMRMPGLAGKLRGPTRPRLQGESSLAGPGTEGIEAASGESGELALPGGRAEPLAGGGSRGGKPSSPSVAQPALLPSEQQIAKAIGSGTQDYLEDIDDGNETALNAKSWKFASFFNRVKQQVREHWNPADAYQRRDPTGAIYGNRDRHTVLRVQLKPDGTLANVALERQSGIDFLDDEAVEAFKLAQPFPNPPKQLVGDSGFISFRFGFVFELSGAPHMRIFRYNRM